MTDAPSSNKGGDWLWRQAPSPFPEMSAWASTHGGFHYTLTHDAKDKLLIGWWSATAMPVGAVALESIIELGTYKKRTDAEAACQRHYRGTLS